MRRLFLITALGLVGCGEDLEASSIAALEGRCATCHPQHAEQHARSAHGRADTSEVFIALRARATRDLGERTAEFCDGCHRPSGGDAAGGSAITCADCHAATGNFGTENGRLAIDDTGPVRGRYNVVAEEAPHAVKASKFLASSDLCGTCHQVAGPAGFKERPFDHWMASPAASEGVGCADCHLGPRPGVPEARSEGPIANLPDLPSRPLSNHAPVGLGSDDPKALIASAVDIELGPDFVAVTSLGRGHHTPDGASFLRELWLEIETAETTERVWLSNRLERDGTPVVLPTEADHVVENALVPNERRVVESIAPTRACVRFRKYRPDLLEALELDPSLAGPIVDVVCVER